MSEAHQEEAMMIRERITRRQAPTDAESATAWDRIMAEAEHLRFLLSLAAGFWVVLLVFGLAQLAIARLFGLESDLGMVLAPAVFATTTLWAVRASSAGPTRARSSCSGSPPTGSPARSRSRSSA